MKPMLNILIVLVPTALLLVLPIAGWAGDPPQEPGEDALLNEDVNIVTGFYIREYSLARNGIVDYRTARQILLSEYNEHWNTVVETKAYPLFFWYDADQDGRFEMWIDRQVEGCRCDIVRYDAEGPTQPVN